MYHPISIRDQSRLHQFGKKVLPGILHGYALIEERTWKGDILIAEIEELETMDASEIYLRRINAKEVLITQKGDSFIFPTADGTAKLSGRDYEFREPTLWRKQTVGKMNRKSLNRQNQKMTLKPAKTFGQYKVTSSIVIT